MEEVVGTMGKSRYPSIERSRITLRCRWRYKEWPLAIDDFGWREPKYFWPIAILKQSAKYPHIHQTWLSGGHTIGSVERPEPLGSQVDFTGMMLLNPATCPEGANEVRARPTEGSRPVAHRLRPRQPFAPPPSCAHVTITFHQTGSARGSSPSVRCPTNVEKLG
jgi:Suppressor of fused protein (SUFU)